MRCRCISDDGVGVEVDHTTAAAGLRCVDRAPRRRRPSPLGSPSAGADRGGRRTSAGRRPRCAASRSSPATGTAPRCGCLRSTARNVGELGRRPHLHLRPACSRRGHRRRVGEASDVAHHQALALGVVEQLVEHRVDVMHPRHRQPLPKRPPVRNSSAYIASRSVARSSCSAHVAEARQHVRADRRAVAARASSACGPGSRDRRATARRTRAAASGSAPRTCPSGARRAAPVSAACASFFVRNERFDWRRRPPSCQVAWATHDVAPEGVSRR